MKTIEASGKTVEEALSQGLKQLGCDLSQVTYEVIDRGSPGLFGMFGRLARVKISVEEQPQEDEDFNVEMPVLSLDPAKAAPQKKESSREQKAESKPKAKKPKAEKSAQAEEAAASQTEETPAAEKPQRAKKGKKDAKKPKQAEPEADQPLTEAQKAVLSPAREFPPLDVSKLSELGKKAYDFVSEITKLMGVNNLDIRILEEENQIFVDITGDVLGVLIGRRGDTLDAVQYLTSLNVNRDKPDYTRVTIDVEHYRAKREETLVKLANRMAARARKSGRRVVLEPMNPYERRVLHSALQNDPYVQTHSEGEDPYRRVIITLK